MMHVVHLIQRRFPDKASSIVWILAVASLSGIAIGVGLLLQR